MNEAERLVDEVLSNWHAVVMIVKSPELLSRHLEAGGAREIISDILRTARILTPCMKAWYFGSLYRN